MTLVGTSPNILVSRVRSELLGVPFGMFDFAPVGLGVVAAGLAFLSVGWRLFPGERRAQASAAAAFEVHPYHQCNTLVMGPGGYRFGDYWRLGLPLSIIVIVVGTVLIPLFWRLK